MSNILDFGEAKKKKDDEKAMEQAVVISQIIADFCMEQGLEPMEFLDDCEDMSEEGKIHAVKHPTTKEIVLAFFKVGEKVSFLTPIEYHNLEMED